VEGRSVYTSLISNFSMFMTTVVTSAGFGVSAFRRFGPFDGVEPRTLLY
jgi:hypothetical protein